MSPYDGSAEAGDGEPEKRPVVPCPVCRQPMVAAHKPFCSERCRDIDLHRWAAGVYRVPTDEPPEEDDAAEPAKRADE